MLMVIKLADKTTATEIAVFDNTVTKVGAKYVAGDVTLSIGFTSGEGKDSTTIRYCWYY